MFDAVVITAANAAQARGYRAQIAWRKRLGIVPRGLETLVIPDPKGERAGSLGATVNALKRLGARRGDRIFICHSGGDARRTPGYAAMGKAFTPLPAKDGRTALFDIILANMEKLPAPDAGGVLVACGDVLITFDFASADLSNPGVTGFAFMDGAARAARHGVYVPEGKPRAGCAKVADFLQKPAFAGGRHAIDTGILWIDWPTAELMAASGWRKGDLYSEFADALLSGFAQFRVNIVKRCGFFHIGSSRELLECMTKPSPTSRRYAFRVSDPNEVWGDRFSLADETIETCVPPGCGAGRPARGRCLTFLPVGEKDWVRVEYSIGDNFKEDGKWEKRLYRLGTRRVCLKELMPLVNHRRLLDVYSRRVLRAENGV